MATNTIIGINRNYAAIVGCAAAFTAGVVVTLAMRVMSKVLTRAPFAWEDYTIFLAAALYITTEGLMLKGVAVGRNSKVLNDPDDMFLTRMVYVYSIFYFAVIALSIASILLLYRRIFVKPFIRHATTILLVLTVCWWIPCMIIEAGYFGAAPETFPGDPENTTPFRISYLNWWLAVGVIEQVIIVIAICLPVREIYMLQLDLQKRLSMMFVFAISYICVGTGIARLAMIYHPNQKNLDISIGDVWVSTHLGTAIMSANLPVCWPIFLRTKRLLGFSQHSSEKSGHKALDVEEVGSRGAHRLADNGRVDSGVGSVLEAATVGPTTKDGNIRNDTMARDMGLDSREVSPSSTQIGTEISHKEGRTTSSQDQDSRLSRWLQLRPFDWRMSLGASMFSSQRSRPG